MLSEAEIGDSEWARTLGQGDQSEVVDSKAVSSDPPDCGGRGGRAERLEVSRQMWQRRGALETLINREMPQVETLKVQRLLLPTKSSKWVSTKGERK